MGKPASPYCLYEEGEVIVDAEDTGGAIALYWHQ